MLKKSLILVLVFMMAFGAAVFADTTEAETTEVTEVTPTDDVDAAETDETETVEVASVYVTIDGIIYLMTVDQEGTIVSLEVVEEEPADGTEEPADGTEEPADDTEEPADGTEEPADGTEEPADDTEEPADGTEEPADGTEEPADGTEEPADGTEEPVDGTEEPADGTEEPVDETLTLEDLVGMNFNAGIEVLSEEAEEVSVDIVTENEDLLEALEDQLEENDENPNAERFQNALKYGITNGKMNLLEKLSATEGFDLEEWSQKSVKEIMLQIKMNKKAVLDDETEEESEEAEQYQVKKVKRNTKAKGKK